MRRKERGSGSSHTSVHSDQEGASMKSAGEALAHDLVEIAEIVPAVVTVVLHISTTRMSLLLVSCLSMMYA